MSEQTTTGTRPAGTSALIYAVLGLVAALPAIPLGTALEAPLLGLAGFLTLGAAVVALVVGVVKRLAGSTQQRPDVRRIALVALGPVGLMLALALVLAALR